ncbi:MAG: acyl-CoA/acyl-ACP dehydrogenase [Proteobacteria bacterium]|nr:acyl-CoA/acyl-ACP dehydrogenase [Pseudomonadota bacterium]MDA1059788.1 acyl-CoA/acyl-ACP dehydrogenase [Pseudomonadota bacterium]
MDNTSQSDDLRLTLDTVDRFVDRHIPIDELRRRDREHAPPFDLMPMLGAAGLLGLPFPTEFGGQALPWSVVARVEERLGYRAAMLGTLFDTTVCFGGMSLLTYGTERQRAELLPRMIRGEALFALALTEPGAGSDAGAIQTRAKKVDGGWRVTGRKTWSSNAKQSTFMVTPCRTDPNARGSRGITMMLIAPDATGVHMTELSKIGNAGLTSWDIGLDDVFVSDDDVMGEVDRGFYNLMSTLHYARAGLAASAVGQAQRAVDIAIEHARDRAQFGQPISAFQVIQHRIADMQMRVDQARLITYHLADLISDGKPCRREAAQAKVIATEALHYVADHGMQILASAGYASESDMQRIWRDARLYTFGEGSNEIQRNIIAKELGL